MFLLAGLVRDAMAQAPDLCIGEDLPPPGSVDFLRNYRPDMQAPSRLAIDGYGNVMAVDPARNQIVVRAPDGRVVARENFPTVPRAVAVGGLTGKGSLIYVAEASGTTVTAFSADWEPLFELGAGPGEFIAANDIAVDPASGNVFVVDGGAHVVKVYGMGGGFLDSFGGYGEEPGLFGFPTAITVDLHRQEVLVADQLNFRIQVFELDGTFICRLGDANGADPGAAFFGTRTRLFTVPQGIAVDGIGRIYVADAAEGRVRVTDRDGTVLAEIGGFGNVPNQLRVPLDVVIDTNGRLFVSDSNNARLSMYGIDVYSDPEEFAPATAVFSPDPFDALGVVEKFEVIIEIPGYRLSEIAYGSITANSVPVDLGSIVIGDQDADGEPDLFATFDGDALAATLAFDGPNPVSVRGLLTDIAFDATASITVIGFADDADWDGVMDDVDTCLDTPAESAVDDTGCSITQLCPCESRFDGTDWPTHGEFVACTADASHRFVDARLIGRAELGGIVSAASRAQCPRDGE